MPACVTGLGVYTPAGTSVDELMANMLAGRSAIRALPEVASLGLPALAGARFDSAPQVPDIEPHLLRHVDRVSLMSLLSAQQALTQAGLRFEHPRQDVPLIWGCAMGGITTLDDAYCDLLTHGRKRVRPTTIPYTMPSAPAFHVAHLLNVCGPSTTLSVACASSALAIAHGLAAIERGEADIVLVGGAESMMTPVAMRGWQMAGALCALDPAAPERSCRPFGADRTGFAMAEGAACLVLESESHARARNATVLGRVLGYGHTTDARHISRPDAAAQTLAMRQALTRSGTSAEDIVYVNAHGTATPVGDTVELQSVRDALGAAAPRATLGSTKGLHGHLIGAAGALEALITLEALRRGELPGTPSCVNLDPAADGMTVSAENTQLPPGAHRALSNSFAFGGVNTTLVLEACHVASH